MKKNVFNKIVLIGVSLFLIGNNLACGDSTARTQEKEAKEQNGADLKKYIQNYGKTKEQKQKIEQFKREIEWLSIVKQKFNELKGQNKLPLLKPSDVGGKTKVYQIKNITQQKTSLGEEIINEIKKCTELLAMDVEFNGQNIKYFFCIEDAVPSLIAVYKQENNKWIKVQY